jgi:hypothetical protein
MLYLWVLGLLFEGLRCATRALAGAGVGAGALAAHGQTTAMAETTVTADVHQTLDVHGGFAAQVAFDGVTGNRVADALEVAVVEVFDLFAVERPMPKMAVRPTSACWCGGMLIPAIRAMSVS